MKIGNLFVCLMLLFLVLPVSGKKLTNEKKLQLILEKIDKAANKVKTFSATFKQTDLDPVFDELDESYGSFVFQKTKNKRSKEAVFKLRFDYKKPDKSITIINGSKVIIYSPEMDAPQESYLVDKVKLQVFIACFLSKKMIEKNYEVILENSNRKKITLQLIPKTQTGKNHFRELRITFSAVTWLPSTIYQIKNNSQQTTIIFKNVRTNQIMSSQTFTTKSLKHLYR